MKPLYAYLMALVAAFFVGGIGAGWLAEPFFAALVFALLSGIFARMVFKNPTRDVGEFSVGLFVLAVFCLSFHLLNQRMSEERRKLDKFDRMVQAWQNNIKSETIESLDNEVWLIKHPEARNR